MREGLHDVNHAGNEFFRDNQLGGVSVGEYRRLIVSLASCELGTSIPEWLNVPLKDVIGWAESVREHQEEVIKRIERIRRRKP